MSQARRNRVTLFKRIGGDEFRTLGRRLKANLKHRRVNLLARRPPERRRKVDRVTIAGRRAPGASLKTERIAKRIQRRKSSNPGWSMASAARQAPDLTQREPACSERSQSHMDDVRKTNAGRAAEEPGNAMKATDVGKTSNDGGADWGGDRIDPRLFYFRALLESDRFFGGGGRFGQSA